MPRLAWSAALLASASALSLGGTLGRRALLGAIPSAVGAAALASAAVAADGEGVQFRSATPIQFVAALGDPADSSGTGAETWGLWPVDPGPRGIMLKNYDRLSKANGNARGVNGADWKFDTHDWWLEEHGLIMEAPDPLPLTKGPGTDSVRYVVTGDRQVTTVLTVEKSGKWSLEKGTLYDVTHLPCRSARYTGDGASSCSPTAASQKDFPVRPGAAMPAVGSCAKQDYAVLFVVGVEA